MAKICIVSPYHWSGGKGGAEYRAHTLADYLANHTSHSVTYVARFLDQRREDRSYRLVRIPTPGLSLRWGYSPDAVALYRTLDEERPDVLLSFVAGAYTGVVSWYARRKSIPVFWFLASDAELDPTPNVGITSPAALLDRQLFRWGARGIENVIAQSTHQARRFNAVFDREALAVVRSFHEPVSGSIEKGSTFTVLWVSNIKP
jgi:hypothetical protein